LSSWWPGLLREWPGGSYHQNSLEYRTWPVLHSRMLILRPWLLYWLPTLNIEIKIENW
jgi:hypothetical protein